MITYGDLVYEPRVIEALVASPHDLAITIDVDALDASLMPAVMAPSPGGLDYTQVTDLILGTTRRAELVAFDLIEFVPTRDRDGTCAITAASLVLCAIGALANR